MGAETAADGGTYGSSSPSAFTMANASVGRGGSEASSSCSSSSAAFVRPPFFAFPAAAFSFCAFLKRRSAAARSRCTANSSAFARTSSTATAHARRMAAPGESSRSAACAREPSPRSRAPSAPRPPRADEVKVPRSRWSADGICVIKEVEVEFGGVSSKRPLLRGEVPPPLLFDEAVGGSSDVVPSCGDFLPARDDAAFFCCCCCC